jgi:hypothetical protein
MAAMRATGAVLLVVGVIGCAEQATEVPLDRVELRPAIGAGADVAPVGIAVAPDGRRYVFDEQRGLYRLDGDAAVAVVPMAQLPDPGVEIRPPFTDLVALAPDVFAITAIGDGFLLDSSALTLTQHFCYEPGGIGDGLTQRTDALAYDAVLDRIYAQPRTFDGDTITGSQIGGYERASGFDVEWHPLDRDVAAGGMVVMPGVGLVLGEGDRLDRYDLATDEVDRLDDLGRFGVGSIQGLAVDAAASTLLVLDGAADAVIEIELARLGT